MNRIPVVFATDNNFVPYCGVAIFSLISNASANNCYEIFVLYNELSENSIYRLESLSTENVTVKCVCIHDKVRELKVSEYGHLTAASAYRIYIAEMFSEYKKIIYIDSDVIVNDDIAKLYGIDIGNNVLGATRAIVAKEDNYYNKVLNIDRDDYFNAGILLINTERFSADGMKEKCISLLKERTDFHFMDQCALNIACQGNVFFIDKKWNYEWMYLFGEFDDFEEIKNPSIIHYDSIEKPWTNPEEKLADYFWDYARKTIFYEEIIQKANLSISGEVLRNIGKNGMGKRVAVYGAGYVGKRFVRNLLKMSVCNLVLWVDRDFENKKNDLMTVDSIDKIYDTEFDCIIITILDKDITKKVKDMLINNGIDEDKVKIYF